MIEIINKFLRVPPENAGTIYNERSLQLELGCFLRSEGFEVQFERPFEAKRPIGSTKPPKTNLDVLVIGHKETMAIELKVPLNKQHPETFYEYCADVEFVEALIRSNRVHYGFCLMITNDRVFWQDSGRGSPIHNYFRRQGDILTGTIPKPTGARDTSIVLTGKYSPAKNWTELNCPRLMSDARYLLTEVHL